jgi:hypothetical protein
MTILACRSSLIDPNQIGNGTTSIGPSAPAPRERLGSAQGRHSKSSHCLESAPRISSVNAEAATTNGGFGQRPLHRVTAFARVQCARPPEGRINKHPCDNLPHLSRACVRLAQTCVLMSSSGQTVFVTESSVKVQPSTGYAHDSCPWERSLSMIRAQLAEPAEDCLILISSGFYDAYWNARP